MGFDALKFLMSFANLALLFVYDSKKRKREKDESIANFLCAVALCLETMASDMRSDKPITRQCSELTLYLKNFSEIAKIYLREEEDRILYNYLIKAQSARFRQLFLVSLSRELNPHHQIVHSNTGKSLEDIAASLESIAGIFRASANILKIAP
jgi:hypothetical protein